MFIYLVTRPDADDVDYDEYDSFVCVAADEQAARSMHPDGSNDWSYYRSWIRKADIAELIVTCLGTAHADQQQAIILASFNAG